MYYILVVVQFPTTIRCCLFYSHSFLFFFFSIFVDRKTIFIVRRLRPRSVVAVVDVAHPVNQAEPITTLASRLPPTTSVLVVTVTHSSSQALPPRLQHHRYHHCRSRRRRSRPTSTRKSSAITPVTIQHHRPCHLSIYFSTTRTKPTLVISSSSRTTIGGCSNPTHCSCRHSPPDRRRPPWSSRRRP